jgi:acyl-CoA-binding protein
MSLEESFKAASAAVTQLPEKPNPEEMLKLYALYKQGTEGDVRGEKPGMIQFIARAKFEAWEALQGQSKEAAMQSYIDLVKALQARHAV